MPLLLVCILLTLDLTLASYVSNLINLIIRPAGRSRSFKWLGRGDPNSAPLHIPRPIFIPRWIPHSQSQYTAKWVPTLPPTHSHSDMAVGASQTHGFGAPKPNSIIKGESLHLKMVAPPPRYPTQQEHMKSAPSNSVAAIDVHPRTPTDKVPEDYSGFEAPHGDDIVASPLKGASINNQVITEPSNYLVPIEDISVIPEDYVAPTDTSGFSDPHGDDIVSTHVTGVENESGEYVNDLTTFISVKEDPVSTDIPIFELDVRNQGIEDFGDLITDASVAESITILSNPSIETKPIEIASPDVDESESSDTRRLFQVYQNDQFADIKSSSPYDYGQPRFNNDVTRNHLADSREDKSSPVQSMRPQGRAIPYPVSFPISPLGLTLDFPKPSEFSALQAGVRSSRSFEAAPYVPYGTRLNSKSRSYTKRAYYG